MSSDIIAKIIVGFSVGIVLALFATPLFVLLKKIVYHPTQKKKLLDEAIKKGHVVKAKLIKTHDINRHTEMGVHPTGKKMATYEYSYNGKTYKRQFISINKFGDEVDLYFISNPRKAEFGGNLWTTAKNHWIRSYFIMTFIMGVIASIILIFK